VVVIACWQAFQARDIKSEFSEAKYIGLAVFSMSQAFVTGIPIVTVVRDIPEAFYLVLTFLIFILCMIILLLIFLPKVFMDIAYAGLSEADQRKMMAASVQQSALQSGSSMFGLPALPVPPRAAWAADGDGSSLALRPPEESQLASDQTPTGRADQTPTERPEQTPRAISLLTGSVGSQPMVTPDDETDSTLGAALGAADDTHNF
jgi:type II secretory pathway pseudopilin PulG